MPHLGEEEILIEVSQLFIGKLSGLKLEVQLVYIRVIGMLGEMKITRLGSMFYTPVQAFPLNSDINLPFPPDPPVVLSIVRVIAI